MLFIENYCEKASPAKQNQGSLQVLADCRDALPVVWDLLGTRIALEVKNAQVRHAGKDLHLTRLPHQSHTALLCKNHCLGQNVWIPKLVILQVQRGNRGVHKMNNIFHT